MNRYPARIPRLRREKRMGRAAFCCCISIRLALSEDVNTGPPRIFLLRIERFSFDTKKKNPCFASDRVSSANNSCTETDYTSSRAVSHMAHRWTLLQALTRLRQHGFGLGDRVGILQRLIDLCLADPYRVERGGDDLVGLRVAGRVEVVARSLAQVVGRDLLVAIRVDARRQPFADPLLSQQAGVARQPQPGFD